MKIAVIAQGELFPGEEWPWMDNLYQIQNATGEFSKSLWKVLERSFEQDIFDQVLIYLTDESAPDMLLQAHNHKLSTRPERVVFYYSGENLDWVRDKIREFGFPEPKINICAGIDEIKRIALKFLNL